METFSSSCFLAFTDNPSLKTKHKNTKQQQTSDSFPPIHQKRKISAMEWHESLRELIRSKRGFDNEGHEDAQEESNQREQRIADLLIVDNAKVHRRLYESQSTVAETQGSNSSSSGSLNEDDLSVLFEDLNLYNDDDNKEGVESLHRSYPVSRRRGAARRHRIRDPRRNEQITSLAVAVGSRNVNDEAAVEALLADWGSNSDSFIDYSSLDDMLREENSKTASARENVFQPERRVSFETSFEDRMSVASVVEEGSDLDCKLAAKAPWRSHYCCRPRTNFDQSHEWIIHANHKIQWTDPCLTTSRNRKRNSILGIAENHGSQPTIRRLVIFSLKD